MSELRQSAPYLLDPYDPDAPFPDPELALRQPDGLLAIGGDLSIPRLLNAYRSGIFPWYSDNQPILWWSPDPRAVLTPETLRITRSLRKSLRNRNYRVTADRAFEPVIRACATARARDDGTWITDDIIAAYCRMHAHGYAHSVECWHADELVGGLYGVALGRVFFGESMFSLMTDASKVALACLVGQLREWDFRLIDAQVHSPHVASLGARPMPRKTFREQLARLVHGPDPAGPWNLDPRLVNAIMKTGHLDGSRPGTPS